MDQNLTVSYEEQKAQWQEKRKQQQKENAEIFKKLAPASFVYALIYTVCIYKNMTGAAVLLWVAATIGYICYIVKTVKERKIFNTTIFFAAYMLILAVNTFTTGNEWIIWMERLAVLQDHLVMETILSVYVRRRKMEKCVRS